MKTGGWLLFAAACGGAATQASNVTICPPGTVLDPTKHECVAMEGVKPVVTDPTTRYLTPRTLPICATVLALVNRFCTILPYSSPRVLVQVSTAITRIATAWAVESEIA